jgi:pantothenate kinase type III
MFNFDVVSEKGEFLGGLICPAVGMAIRRLFAKTVRLPSWIYGGLRV